MLYDFGMGFSGFETPGCACIVVDMGVSVRGVPKHQEMVSLLERIKKEWMILGITTFSLFHGSQPANVPNQCKIISTIFNKCSIINNSQPIFAMSIVINLAQALKTITSTTAQAGGKSFQKKKPKGEGGLLRCMDDRAIHWKSDRWLESICVFLCLSVWLSICLRLCLFVYGSINISVFLRSISLFIHILVHLSVCRPFNYILYIYLSV